ncbi:hypothetical protein IJ21_16480 [Paenibacillus sp. 32O-W]|uniref:DUF1292 domain-containing protein n=1 Tax=Paenibacillus sp. 32O-W TaxID=1695218 RepID=UPI00072119F1|nr:DUF1292 domain-containing protein [Paenibacillus sp. 32O-W]ALS27050.1 hypothetical protein IJ21_16480 [Paenibacillus sp. 32O-W]
MNGIQPVRVRLLASKYGEEVELLSEGGQPETYRIMAEFELGGQVYAALQSPAMRKENEVEMFRVVVDGEEPELESIEDDEEWEAAAEAYDDLLFQETERS